MTLQAPPALDQAGPVLGQQLLRQLQDSPAPSPFIEVVRRGIDLDWLPETLEDFVAAWLSGSEDILTAQVLVTGWQALSGKDATQAAAELYTLEESAYASRYEALEGALERARNYLEETRERLQRFNIRDSADLQTMSLMPPALEEAIAQVQSAEKALDSLEVTTKLTGEEYRQKKIGEAEAALESLQAAYRQRRAELEDLYSQLVSIYNAAYGAI